jgi:chromate transporter
VADTGAAVAEEASRSAADAQAGGQDLIPFRSAVRTWFAISLQTFGGPAGQIAVMQRVLVEEKRWIGQRRFLHALNYCMLLPGPEAQQLATYIGWLLNGTRGALAAGTLFVLPGALVLLALSAAYVAFGETTAVTAVFAGLAPAVVAIVAQAVVRVGRPCGWRLRGDLRLRGPVSRHRRVGRRRRLALEPRISARAG